MTRKRFVKLAMANGYSRNSANRIAEQVNSAGKSYADAYKALAAVKKLAVTLSPALSEAMAKATEAMGRFAKAIGEAIPAFAKAFSATMASK